ncbi:MAG: PEP-CTERM sorting domain-containing protein [Phycisphaerae bacterium]
MRTLVALVLVGAMATVAAAQVKLVSEDFEDVAVDAIPAGWTSDYTVQEHTLADGNTVKKVLLNDGTGAWDHTTVGLDAGTVNTYSTDPLLETAMYLESVPVAWGNKAELPSGVWVDMYNGTTGNGYRFLFKPNTGSEPNVQVRYDFDSDGIHEDPTDNAPPGYNGGLGMGTDNFNKAFEHIAVFREAETGAEVEVYRKAPGADGYSHIVSGTMASALNEEINTIEIGGKARTTLTDQHHPDAISFGTVMSTDFNFDGDTDIFQLDLQGDAQILLANIGTTSGAHLSDGDANNDGDVDVFQLNLEGDAQLLLANLPSEAPAGTATATYDYTTGEVIVEVGSDVQLIGIESIGNVVQGLSPEIDGEGPAQYDEDTVAWFTLTALGEGTYNLGAILPTDLTADDIGFGYNTSIAEVTVVPEPATMSLLALGGLVAIRRRRRK